MNQTNAGSVIPTYDNPSQNQEISEQQSQSQNESSSPLPESPSKSHKPNPNICSNKICADYKPTKYNVVHENNTENLCPDCVQQYSKEAFCLYCNQIYFDYSDDGKQWIMCDQCQRWVHTQCADFQPANSNAIFSCIKCKKIEIPGSNGNAPGRKSAGNGRSNPSKMPERRKTQECMLNNFGFFWQLSPAELAEDVQKLKQFLK